MREVEPIVLIFSGRVYTDTYQLLTNITSTNNEQLATCTISSRFFLKLLNGSRGLCSLALFRLFHVDIVIAVMYVIILP